MKKLLLFIFLIISLSAKTQNIEAKLFNGGAYGSNPNSDLAVTLRSTGQYPLGSASSPTIFVFRIEQTEWDASGVTSISIIDNSLDMGDGGTPDAEWNDDNGFHYIYYSAGVADWDLNSCPLTLGNNSTYLSLKFNDMSNSFVVEMTLKDVDPVVGSEVNLVDENQLIIANGIVMPLQLLNFTVSTYKNHSSLLKWETSNEINVDRYEIERSQDTEIWKNIGFVKAKNISTIKNNYSFIDRNVFKGFNKKTYYYRLKMIDNDAQFNYSKIESVLFSNERDKIEIEVFPNPSSKIVYYKLSGVRDNSDIKLYVYDNKGKLIFKRIDKNNSYKNLLLDKYDRQLDNGLYNLILKDENNNKYRASFILSR